MPVSHSNGTRKRHIPVKDVSHVYWSETKKGRAYEVRHPRNAEGRRLFEVVGTRLDAAKARAREVHGDSGPRVTSVGTTLAEVFADWQKTRQMRPRSAESFDANMRLHVLPKLGRMKVRDIDKSAVLRWLAGLKRKDGRGDVLSDGTRRLLLATLQIVFAHAVEIGAASSNPVAGLARKHKPKAGEGRRRILSPDEEARLLAYCGAFPWLAPIITVALAQALRLGEVLGLAWDDVDFVGGKLHVRRSLGRDGTLGTTKGGKSRVIDLMPAARQELLTLRGGCDGTGLVFRNRLGGPRQLRDVQRAFAKAKERAALAVTDDGPVTFHTLRHTKLSRLGRRPACPSLT